MFSYGVGPRELTTPKHDVNTMPAEPYGAMRHCFVEDLGMAQDSIFHFTNVASSFIHPALLYFLSSLSLSLSLVCA